MRTHNMVHGHSILLRKLLICLGIGLLMATAGCKKNPAGPTAGPYVGSWYLTEMNLLETPNIIALEFRNDGTVTVTPRSTDQEPFNRDLTDSFPATYKIADDGRLILTGSDGQTEILNAKIDNDELSFTGTVPGNSGPINWYERYHRVNSGETIADGLKKQQEANIARQKAYSEAALTILSTPGLVIVPTESGIGGGGKVKGVAIQIEPVSKTFNNFHGKAWFDDNNDPHISTIDQGQGSAYIYMSIGQQVDPSSSSVTPGQNKGSVFQGLNRFQLTGTGDSPNIQFKDDNWELKNDPALYKEIVQEVTSELNSPKYYQNPQAAIDGAQAIRVAVGKLVAAKSLSPYDALTWSMIQPYMEDGNIAFKTGGKDPRGRPYEIGPTVDGGVHINSDSAAELMEGQQNAYGGQSAANVFGDYYVANATVSPDGYREPSQQDLDYAEVRLNSSILDDDKFIDDWAGKYERLTYQQDFNNEFVWAGRRKEIREKVLKGLNSYPTKFRVQLNARLDKYNPTTGSFDVEGLNGIGQINVIGGTTFQLPSPLMIGNVPMDPAAAQKLVEKMLGENNQSRQILCQVEVTLSGSETRNPGFYGGRTFVVTVDNICLKDQSDESQFATLQP